MTRKQRKWVFWLLVFSLNLVPLVAQGGPKKTVRKTSNHGTTPVSPSPAPQPKAKDDPVTPPPPKYSGDAKELSVADLSSSDYVRDFDKTFDGARPNETFKLIGRVFNDCKGLLEISFEPSVSCHKAGTDSSTAPITAAAFTIKDKGGYAACMKSHAKDTCTDSTCSFLSSLPGATQSLSSLKHVNVMVLHHDANANELKGAQCEDFATAYEHIDQATIDATNAATEASKKQARLEQAQDQIRNCIHSEAELKQAYQACNVLVALGSYSSQKECISTEKLDSHMIDILKNRAKTGSLDELSDVASRLANWAYKNPKQCKQAIEPLHVIAKRLAMQKVKRGKNDDGDSTDPMQGYDDAYAALDDAKSIAPCLDEDNKISEMQENLQMNRTEKLCEIRGVMSMDCQQAYMDIAQDVQQNVSDNCNSWEMDTACSAATRDVQSLNSIGQMAYSANVKAAQSNAAICQMIMRSSNGMMGVPQQCQSYAYGGAGMYGGLGGGSFGFGYGAIGSSSYGFGHL